MGVNLLSADDIGKAGETLFENLASRAKLVCNASHRDRSGWDFIIDFPMENIGDRLLDQAQKTSCFVQLKSTTQPSSTVSLKLSAADLLAKTHYPAFVVFFRLDTNGEPIQCHLIHLIGKPLAKVLRRLRQAEKDERTDTNRLKISFDAKKYGVRFDPTPHGLLSALLDACGPDSAIYTKRKLFDLEQLGYEDGHYRTDASFEVENDHQLARMLLGIEPIKLKNIRSYDVRFGIPLPCRLEDFETVGEILLSPPSISGYTVSVTGPPFEPAAIFSVELRTAEQPDGKIRASFHNADLTILFVEDNDQMYGNVTFEARKRTLSEMTNYLRALTYLIDGGDIMITRAKFGSSPLKFPGTTGLEGPFLESIPSLYKFVSGWQKIADIIGITPTDSIDFDDLSDRYALFAADLLTNPETPATFTFDSCLLFNNLQQVDGIYFNNTSFAGLPISYAVEITLERNKINPEEFNSVSLKPIDIRHQINDIDEYMADLISKFPDRVMLHPDGVIDDEDF